MSTELIQITNLTKRFKQKTVFFELNLSFPKHKITVIYGKSGSGKSTLLKLLGGIEPYQAGMIYFNGQKLPRARKHKATVYRRDHVSFIFQDYGLIKASSIKTNLLIGLAYSKLSHSEKLAKMNEALTEVGLNYPLKTKVDILSGGEQQRVAIARALLKPGELVLADEPTGSLDLVNRELVFELLKKLRDQGKTVIMVSHDPYFEQVCDHVIKL
ncbi:ABC superfamily ATP binding cassette transporter ABC protein [Ligilactobacillus apodemi DSM 16634 = JCM 16172]|uniref:ABC superfamily ATP binding cassette transporter ABC protein n=1 Tax=Ligilactobacillus apodemi DSM 16634 = JCM 16172 TaxID=1423724 RepID=A0A0R1U717_9LACO|nr:ATP-binding cassette domain-containing protein [Ligilactobacillus apodemi]KRL87123.1 ABC superfamily ATP binding cassette transporter ABC protein [Ligilactobacillus apodemi DSM 16634 = JCM 16172]